MNIKFLLLCLIVMMMATTETTNAYRKREWRKKQEEIDPLILSDYFNLRRNLEKIMKAMEEDIREGRR